MPVRRLRGRLPTIPPDILAGLEIDSTPSPIHDVESQLEQALWCRTIAENAGLADPNVGRHVVIGERHERSHAASSERAPGGKAESQGGPATLQKKNPLI